jgi:hypothetical protein
MRDGGVALQAEKGLEDGGGKGAKGMRDGGVAD